MSGMINGYPIIASWATPAGGGYEGGNIIVVDRSAEHEERYVVAWLRDGSTSWSQSAYCLDLAEAARVFAVRIEREVRR